MAHLAIIVPYRDRAQHLATFANHVSTYFARDTVAQTIDYRVVIAEQEHGLPFNKGTLVNAAFSLIEPETDYMCVHDVDYLPIWADYRKSDVPMPIVWFGAEARPVAPGRSAAGIKHDLPNFFGGAVLVPNAQFRQVDGMANDYWGWGIEDADLRRRFLATGITPGRRRGTFTALDHESNGYFPDGSPKPIGVLNERMFDARWAPGAARPANGLSTFRAEILHRRPAHGINPERKATWEHVLIRLLEKPSEEQRAALAAKAPWPSAPSEFRLGWTALQR
jgi:hypothetical protein